MSRRYFDPLVGLLWFAVGLLFFRIAQLAEPCATAAEPATQEVITVEYVEMLPATQESTSEDVKTIPEEPADRQPTASELALAKLVWGEARGCSVTEQAAVVWCVLNRIDAGYGYNYIVAVITEPRQFAGYHYQNPVDPDILALVQDVLDRWRLEDTNSGEVGRVLPEDFLWFNGDGSHNYFRNAYEGGEVWDWSLPSPYGEEWSA